MWELVSHSHGNDSPEHSDHALEHSADGIRAVKISLLGLMLTAGLQMAVVAVTGSVALLSDTLHNFGDALTALPLWWAFSLARRPANRRFTYGYGRVEDLGGVFVVVTIAVSAAVAAYESVDRLLHPRDVTGIAFVILASVVGFVGNELVAIYRIRAGRRIGSAALVADGLHARTDGLTSLAVLAGAIGVWAGWPLADPIVGLVIAAAILVILKHAAHDVYERLVDAVDPGLVAHVEDILTTVEGLRRVDDVRIRWIGHRLRADVEIGVDARLTVGQGHDIAAKAHHTLLHGVSHLSFVSVHVHAADGEASSHHAELAHHFAAH
jgi:cation diffusion facilitator family transporter